MARRKRGTADVIAVESGRRDTTFGSFGMVIYCEREEKVLTWTIKDIPTALAFIETVTGGKWKLLSDISLRGKNGTLVRSYWLEEILECEEEVELPYVEDRITRRFLGRPIEGKRIDPGDWRTNEDGRVTLASLCSRIGKKGGVVRRWLRENWKKPKEGWVFTEEEADQIAKKCR